ncbi:MAG: hypothetical protein ACRDAM_06455 [Casimicrobium sp.]
MSDEEIFEFGRWLRELESDAWDRQIAEDIDGGRFDDLIAEIENDIAQGNINPL